jgi:hypothetical protein
MMRFLGVVLGAASFLQAQNPVIDAYRHGREDRRREELLQLQRDEFELRRQIEQQRLEQMRRQNELLAEAERLRLQNDSQGSPNSAAVEAAQREIEKALVDLSRAHADFHSYQSKIVALMDRFLPGRDVSVKEYLEGIYVVAKYSPLVKSSEAAKDSVHGK